MKRGLFEPFVIQKTFVPFWGKWGWLLGRPIFFSPLTLWAWGATLLKKKCRKISIIDPYIGFCHYFEVLHRNYNGEIGQKYIGHNFWLGGPIETSSTRLNSILQDLFFDLRLFRARFSQIKWYLLTLTFFYDFNRCSWHIFSKYRYHLSQSIMSSFKMVQFNLIIKSSVHTSSPRSWTTIYILAWPSPSPSLSFLNWIL